ncbi:putative D-3-phosphoglycerate dehydrogenase [Rhizodiscina lignyota]|uniref:D-3-phosphoglycerate dehydrogenase n=1 Tax=Rhizodiscina lignyota TaxID=1504668 RepID=A0A9P4INI9_9PEZI|nr:putative D-3-phosphoglycerate dehydrogenase [Rhizodiscina lignyota]
MSKPKVYMVDPYYQDAIDLLQSNSSVESIIYTDPRKSNWQEDADALLIRSETRLGEAEFSKAKKLKAVVKQGVGIDNVNLEDAKKYGIAVANTPGLNSEAVAELTLGLALSISRRLSEFDRRIRSGEKIVRSKALGKSLYGKTLGVIGMGNIGKVIAKKWIGAMEGKVIGYDPIAPEWKDIPHTRVQQMDELLKESDVVTLHVPLTPQTKHMIGEKEMALMKKDAILINAARGGVVDEAALLKALQEDKLGGAGLDAMDYEPPTMSAYGDGLLKCENVIMTPHIGGSTIENQVRSGLASVETVLALLEGKDVPGRIV